MRGSTTASRTPIGDHPSANPTGPPISGSESRASRAARHSGTALSTSGRTNRFDDLVVDRLTGLQRPAQVGPGLLGGGGTGPVTAAGQLDGGRGVAVRRAVPGPAGQPGVHPVQPAGVAQQDQRGRYGCCSRRPQDSGDLTEGEPAFEDAIDEAHVRK